MATAIEHNAVLEPLEHLATQGFPVTLVKPEADGAISAAAVAEALRPDTLLVSQKGNIAHAGRENAA